MNLIILIIEVTSNRIIINKKMLPSERNLNKINLINAGGKATIYIGGFTMFKPLPNETIDNVKYELR